MYKSSQKRRRGGKRTAPYLRRPPARIRRVKPLVDLPARIPPAVLVRDADARVRGNIVLCVAEAGADAVREARQALVARVHAGREAVADELDGALVRRDLDQRFAGCYVHFIDLDAVGPVCYAKLKGHGGDGEGFVDAGG